MIRERLLTSVPAHGGIFVGGKSACDDDDSGRCSCCCGF